jgi:hypothetical protein
MHRKIVKNVPAMKVTPQLKDKHEVQRKALGQIKSMKSKNYAFISNSHGKKQKFLSQYERNSIQ